jgi:hypothetical protein
LCRFVLLDALERCDRRLSSSGAPAPVSQSPLVAPASSASNAAVAPLAGIDLLPPPVSASSSTTGGGGAVAGWRGAELSILRDALAVCTRVWSCVHTCDGHVRAKGCVSQLAAIASTRTERPAGWCVRVHIVACVIVCANA